MLKQYLIQGYTTNEKRLAELGIKELQQTVELLQKTLTRNELVNEIGVETIQLIMSYTKTWHLLLAYDENELNMPEKMSTGIKRKFEQKFKNQAVKLVLEHGYKVKEAAENLGVGISTLGICSAEKCCPKLILI